MSSARQSPSAPSAPSLSCTAVTPRPAATSTPRRIASRYSSGGTPRCRSRNVHAPLRGARRRLPRVGLDDAASPAGSPCAAAYAAELSQSAWCPSTGGRRAAGRAVELRPRRHARASRRPTRSRGSTRRAGARPRARARAPRPRSRTPRAAPPSARAPSSGSARERRRAPAGRRARRDRPSPARRAPSRGRRPRRRSVRRRSRARAASGAAGRACGSARLEDHGGKSRGATDAARSQGPSPGMAV